MDSEEGLINLQNAPRLSLKTMRLQLSAMPSADKLALERKLKSELAEVRSAIEYIGTKCQRSSARKDTSIVEDHTAISGNGCSSENHKTSVGKKRKLRDIYKGKKVADNEVFVAGKSESALTQSGASKGKTLRLLDDQDGKGQKMDTIKTTVCVDILKKLMTHRCGWVFNEPVDPVKWNIPDYFSIISRPMDLGTIKNKLESMLYSSTQQFAADVQLTFANAMRYNPPDNSVNIMAKELNDIFNARWKPLEMKWRKDSSITMQQSVKKTSTLSCAKSADVGKKCAQISVQDSRKGTMGSRHRYGSVNDKSFTSLRISGTRDSMDRCCNRHDDFTQASSSDIDSERSSGRENYTRCSVASNQGYKKTTADAERGNLNSYLDGGQGAAIIIDRNNAQPCSHPSSPAATFGKGEADPCCEEQLSPSKALRAALLKSRFADTILKAQQKTLLNNSEKGDPVRRQLEREKLAKKHQEEKARIEARIKAQAKAKLKMRREKEREAARLALQKVERSVVIDENSHILKELEDLCYSQPVQHLDIPDQVVVVTFMQYGHVNLMEQLGLFLEKDDDDDDEADGQISADMEEGEIL